MDTRTVFLGNEAESFDEGVSVYKVGEVLPGMAKPQGVVFDFTDGGGVFHYWMDRPSEKEIQCFHSSSPLEIRFVVLRGVIFMLFKFGSLPWIDCPYNVHLSPNLTHLDDVSEGEGYAIQVNLLDCTGYLHNIRLVGLTTKFSKALRSAILEQSKESFDRYEYNQKIQSIYAAYSTNELVKLSRHYCKI